MTTPLPATMKAFLRCSRAAAAIEFALLFPLLLMLLTGTVEITRLAYLHQKLDKLSNAMADLATQSNSATRVGLNNLMVAGDQIMQPFPFRGQGGVIFSSVVTYTVASGVCAVANRPCITWQHSATGSNTSRIGSVGGNPSLPGGYTVNPGQNVIVAEVFYNYTPVFNFAATVFPVLVPQTYYKIAIYKPRQGMLTAIE